MKKQSLKSLAKAFIFLTALMLGLTVFADNPQGPTQKRSDFFLASSGLPMWQVCQAVGEFYGVNVVVYDDLKDKPVFADVSGCSLGDVLDLLTWLHGVEWIERGGQYYIGGNQNVVKIFPSFGVDSKIETVFPVAKLVNDKIIVQGSEREIKKVSDSLSTVINRELVKVQIKVIEVVYDDRLTMGLDWEKSFEYGVDWKNMLKNVHPATHLAMTAAASVQLDEAIVNARYIIDTEVGIMSGSGVNLNIGDEIDRPIYSTSEYGNRVVSGYNTLKTGLIVNLKAFYSSGAWVFDSSVEHSRPVSDLQKSLSKVSTQVKISDFTPFLLANVSTFGGEMNIEQGVPILCKIPYIGYLFGVNKTINLRRDFYVCLRMVRTGNEYTPKAPVTPYYRNFDDFLNHIKNFGY